MIKRSFVLCCGFLKRTEHDIDRQTQMDWPRIASYRYLECTVDKFRDTFTIGDLRTVFGQRRGNRNIVNFFKTACSLSLQST